MTNFGIRYANDLTGEYSEYVTDSVDLLNAQLASYGAGSFFDAVDVGLPAARLAGGDRQMGAEHVWYGHALSIRY